MSQFIYTVDKNLLAPIITNNRDHLPVNDVNTSNNSVVFGKRNVPANNYYYDGDDYIYMVGSYMKDGLTGIPVLKYILAEFSIDKLCVYKKQIVGMWSALVHKKGVTYIFNDYYGLYDVVYNNNIVSNSLKTNLIATGNVELDEFSFIMENFQLGCFPGKTPFANEKKLIREEYIQCDGVTISVRKIQGSLSFDYHFVSEQTSIKELGGLLTKYAKQVSTAFGKPSLFMTGGLDSRLIFASYNQAGVDFKCRYGCGKYTQEGDKLVVEQIAKAYDKELDIMNWIEPNTTDKLADLEYLYKYLGFYNYIDSSSKHRHISFSECSKETPFYAFGYFCEAIRLRDWAEPKGSHFSLYDYIDNNYINKNLQPAYSNYLQYRDYLIQVYQSQLAEIGIHDNYERIPVDMFENFRWMMSRFCDSRMEFVLNRYGYAFSLLSVPEIHERVLALPADVIRGGKFQTKLIFNLDSRLIVDFDVFSHLRWYKIDSNFNKVRKLTTKNVADVILGFLPSIRPYLLRLYRKHRYDSSAISNIELSICTKNKKCGVINVENYNGSLNRLAAFYTSLKQITD